MQNAELTVLKGLIFDLTDEQQAIIKEKKVQIEDIVAGHTDEQKALGLLALSWVLAEKA